MTSRRLLCRGGTSLAVALAAAAVLLTGALWVSARAQVAPKPDLNALAKSSLAQHTGTIMVRGLSQPVEVVRDTWGIPHIYAKNTPDLFFAQGFVVAQDRMWQLEMWRRNGEGRLAEVLGPDYVTRDKFARLLAFRGNWDEEFRRVPSRGQADLRRRLPRGSTPPSRRRSTRRRCPSSSRFSASSRSRRGPQRRC